jgi:hypothetical protein
MKVLILSKEQSNEIVYGLPDQKLYRYPEVLAVLHPNYEDILILKHVRMETHELLSLTRADFEMRDVPFSYGEDFSNMAKKNILLHHRILSSRSLDAIHSL